MHLVRSGSPEPAGSSPVGDAAERAPHVSVRGLGLHQAGRWLFRSLDLAVPRGTFVAVVGPSGAGKSSLLGCLAGLVTPDEGQVVYAGPAGTDRAPGALRGRLGLVFQDLRLVPTATLIDNVLYARLGRRPWWTTAFGFATRERREAFALLQGLGLGSVALHRANRTSGGEQQRAALARALFLEPEVVLADEPVSALDADRALQSLEVLRSDARRCGATVLCVLHDRGLVERFADVVLAVDPRLPNGWRIEPRELRRG